MPLTKFILKEQIEHKRQLLLELEEKCSACEFLKGITPDNEFVYVVNNYDETGSAVLAVAQYNSCNTYAIYMPEELIKKHCTVFKFFLKEILKCFESNEQVVVFSQKAYDTISKYNCGSEIINVKLYV